MKRAQDISLSTIIIAAIALIVLIVVILIFTGKINVFGTGYDRTTQDFKGDKCVVPGAQNIRKCDVYCPQENRAGSIGQFSDCLNAYCCYT